MFEKKRKKNFFVKKREKIDLFKSLIFEKEYWYIKNNKNYEAVSRHNIKTKSRNQKKKKKTKRIL